MAIAKKSAAKAPAVAVAAKAVPAISLLDLSMYVGGGGLPEGNYALEFMIKMHQAVDKVTGANRGGERLGVMVTAHSLTDTNAEPRQQFYSMGTKAHEAFAPNPDTGKSLVAVAGGTGASTLSPQTNWAYLLKSLYDAGMPEDLKSNDLTVLDGVWVHVHSIPEPEERKAFKTSNVAETSQEDRRPGTISIVSEILPKGAPWEDNGGGIPEKGAAPATTAAAVKPNGKALGKVATTPVAPAPQPDGGVTDEELMELALQGATTVLEANVSGVSKLQMKSGMFKAISADYEEEIASQVINAFFKSDDDLNGVVNQLGYKVSGVKVVEA